MSAKLIEGRKWASSVRKCLSQIDGFLHCKENCSEKVNYVEIKELAAVRCKPCYEPSLAQLQVYVDKGEIMINEINNALSSRSKVDYLETLYSRALEFPVELTETSALSCEISSAKVWTLYQWSKKTDLIAVPC
jgi:histone demethylase JARID1